MLLNNMPLEAFKNSYKLGGRPLFINKVSLTLADKKYHKFTGCMLLKILTKVLLLVKKI